MLMALYTVVYLTGCFALGVATALALPSPSALLVFGALLAWWYALGTGALLDWWGARHRADAAARARRAGDGEARFGARSIGKNRRSGATCNPRRLPEDPSLPGHARPLKRDMPPEGTPCS